MVASPDAGDVPDSFIKSFLRSEVMLYCMVESSDAGDVAESCFIITWSLRSEVISYLHG